MGPGTSSNATGLFNVANRRLTQSGITRVATETIMVEYGKWLVYLYGSVDVHAANTNSVVIHRVDLGALVVHITR
jgi:hypothetical protein